MATSAGLLLARVIIAAVLTGFVQDVGGPDVPERAVIRADAQEALLVQQSAQPVPSSGLVDERPAR